MTSVFTKQEQGSSLVIVALFIAALLACCGLVLDIWSLLFTVEQTQGAADSAAQTAVEGMLRPIGSPLDKLTILQWNKSKRAVLTSIAGAQINNLNSAAILAFQNKSAEFNHGSPTLNDWPENAFQSAKVGNLTVSVRRGLFCYTNNASKERIWVDLEGGAYWCLARAIEVKLEVSSIPTYFINAVGAARSSNVTAFAYGNLQMANGCGLGRPNCLLDFGIDNNGNTTAATPTC